MTNFCKSCDYTARDKYDLTKHSNTKKHLENLKKKERMF